MTQAHAQRSFETKNPLDHIAEALKHELNAVNKIILDKMQSDIPLIPQLAGHLIAAGGKRIRPLMTLASAGLFDYKGGRQYRLAACVEFIIQRRYFMMMWLMKVINVVARPPLMLFLVMKRPFWSVTFCLVGHFN